MTSHDQTLDERVAAVAAKARQRYRRRMGLVLPLAVLAGVAGGLLGSSGGDHHRHRHHSATASLIVGLTMAALVIALVFLVVIVLRRRRVRGRMGPHLLMGLDRHERRRALRGLRRGTPDLDPLLREIQLRTASRLLAQQSVMRWLYPLIAASQGALAVSRASEHDRIWIFNAVTAVLIVAVWPVALRQLRGSRLLLQRLNPPQVDTR